MSAPETQPAAPVAPPAAPAGVPQTITGAVLARAADTRLGLVVDDLRLTHAEVVQRAAERAAWLRAGRADGPFHVAVMLDNVPEFVFWLEAAALAGAVVVGANPTHRGDELVRDLTHTECQFLVTDSTYLPLLKGSRIGATLGAVEAGNERVLVLDTAAARATLGAHAGTRAADGDRAGRDTRDPRLPAVYVGHLRCAQGMPVQPGQVGAHRRRRGPDVRAHAPGRVLPVHAAVPLQRAHGRLGPRPHGRRGLCPPLLGPLLRLGLPARRPGDWCDLLQLRREAAVLHPGHARTARRRREPAGARLRQRRLGR